MGERSGSRASHMLVAMLGASLLLLAGCGGGGGTETDPRVLDAGQVDIQLPPGFKVVNKTTVRRTTTDDGSGTESSGNATVTADGVTPTTSEGSVPLEDDSNPTEDLLAAFGKFRVCLEDLGVQFVGAPDPSNPNSPANDPTYLGHLGTCAARSQIVQALQAAQAEQDTLTPAQIKERNKGYLAWRKCMIKRDWKIPEPRPDSQGRLFAFGATSGPQLTPPPGKDLLTSGDIEECASEAQEAIERKG